MMKSFHVEFYDVENEYMTAKAVTARSAVEAAKICREWAIKHFAQKIVVKKGTTQHLFYVNDMEDEN